MSHDEDAITGAGHAPETDMAPADGMPLVQGDGSPFAAPSQNPKPMSAPQTPAGDADATIAQDAPGPTGAQQAPVDSAPVSTAAAGSAFARAEAWRPEQPVTDAAARLGASTSTDITEGSASASAPDRDEDTARRPAVEPPQPAEPSITSTVRLPKTEPSASAGDPPHLSDVGSAFARWAGARMGSVGAFLAAHRLVLAVSALACVAAVLGVVLLGMQAARVPSDEQVSSDARAQLVAPSYTVGPYTSDDPLELRSIEVTRKQPSETRRDACDVSVVATFANGHMESRANATLTYVREDDVWTCTAATTKNASHRAITGVDENKVLASLDTLLQMSDDPDDGRQSMVSLYHDATVHVTESSFDDEGQSDNLTLHCTSTGTFVCYECDLTAHFTYTSASGTWELASVRASKQAKDLGFSPLVGTWKGTFRSQEAKKSKCLAAREAGLAITITSASPTDGGGATIQGTVSGVAHLHAQLDADADQTEGDLQLDEVPFVGTLQQGDSAQDQAGIVFACATQDTVGGTVSLLLVFGSSSAPDSATAKLVSTHSYQATFWGVFPYEEEARFTDSFTLAKAG